MMTPPAFPSPILLAPEAAKAAAPEPVGTPSGAGDEFLAVMTRFLSEPSGEPIVSSGRNTIKNSPDQTQPALEKPAQKPAVAPRHSSGRECERPVSSDFVYPNSTGGIARADSSNFPKTPTAPRSKSTNPFQSGSKTTVPLLTDSSGAPNLVASKRAPADFPVQPNNPQEAGDHHADSRAIKGQSPAHAPSRQPAEPNPPVTSVVLALSEFMKPSATPPPSARRSPGDASGLIENASHAMPDVSEGPIEPRSDRRALFTSTHASALEPRPTQGEAASLTAVTNPNSRPTHYILTKATSSPPETSIPTGTFRSVLSSAGPVRTPVEIHSIQTSGRADSGKERNEAVNGSAPRIASNQFSGVEVKAQPAASASMEESKPEPAESLPQSLMFRGSRVQIDNRTGGNSQVQNDTITSISTPIKSTTPPSGREVLIPDLGATATQAPQFQSGPASLPAELKPKAQISLENGTQAPASRADERSVSKAEIFPPPSKELADNSTTRSGRAAAKTEPTSGSPEPITMKGGTLGEFGPRGDRLPVKENPGIPQPPEDGVNQFGMEGLIANSQAQHDSDSASVESPTAPATDDQAEPFDSTEVTAEANPTLSLGIPDAGGQADSPAPAWPKSLERRHLDFVKAPETSTVRLRALEGSDNIASNQESFASAGRLTEPGRSLDLPPEGPVSNPANLNPPGQFSAAKGSPVAAVPRINATSDAKASKTAQPSVESITAVTPDGAPARTGKAMLTPTGAHTLRDTPLDTSGLGAAPPLGGTGAALNPQRMRSATEENEIAGSVLQKLPPPTEADDDSSEVAGTAKLTSNFNLPGRKQEDSDLPSLVLTGGSPGTASWTQTVAVDKAYTIDRPTIQIERTAQFVKQEVTKVKQSGAESLAVSFKLDSHTELSLQLTTREGQIQASIRCEQGDVAGISRHWGELQASLAKQNVLLLPLEDRFSPRNPGFHSPSEQPGSRRFDQSPQNPQRDTHGPQKGPTLTEVGAKSSQPSKPTSGISSRQGWESWA